MNENISGFWDNLAEGRNPKFLSDLEFICRINFINKQDGIEKTKHIFIISVLKVEY